MKIMMSVHKKAWELSVFDLTMLSVLSSSPLGTEGIVQQVTKPSSNTKEYRVAANSESIFAELIICSKTTAKCLSG